MHLFRRSKEKNEYEEKNGIVFKDCTQNKVQVIKHTKCDHMLNTKLFYSFYSTHTIYERNCDENRKQQK